MKYDPPFFFFLISFALVFRSSGHSIVLVTQEFRFCDAVLVFFLPLTLREVSS